MSVAGEGVQVELLLQDARADDRPGIAGARETKRLRLPDDANDRFLDGPSCRRLAVVDFDPDTGDPLPAPARFVPPAHAGTVHGRYEPPDAPDAPDAPASLAINAFGTAFLTIRMFEGQDGLGRPVTWAFPGEQLLIVPRAGRLANAKYVRETRSLQFFWFTGTSGTPVYTALSRDIVAHECGHALLDAVAPALYESSTPESLAIHEALADTIAVLMALDSRTLRTTVLDDSDYSLDGSNAFSEIAREFGTERLSATGVSATPLRELHNTATRATIGSKPHELSTLLSGILYDTLCQIFASRFERLKGRRSGESTPLSTIAKEALGHAYPRFRSFVLRGIDYLPPGELSFADVGRAMLAADRAIVADADADRERRDRRTLFARRFVTRGLVAHARKMRSPAPEKLSRPPDLLDGLRDSDYLAYAYVAENRRVIGIPAGAPFTVLPRIDARKKVGGQDDPLQRELILKVAWDRDEASSRGTSRKRLVRSGATISLHGDTGRCLALVTSDILDSAHRTARDAFVARLQEEGMLTASAPDGLVSLDESGGFAQLSGTHRLLHLDAAPARERDPAVAPRRALARTALPDPPPGVSPGAYFDLVRSRHR